jgi:hypothetical protein
LHRRVDGIGLRKAIEVYDIIGTVGAQNSNHATAERDGFA